MNAFHSHNTLNTGFAAMALAALCGASPAAAELTFGPEAVIETPGGVIDIVLADLDGDNDLDIASLEGTIGAGMPNFINVLLNDGTGAFGPPSTMELNVFAGLEFFVNDLAAGDFDGDDDVDLAFVGTIAPLTLVFNNGDGSLGPPVVTPFAVDLGPLTAVLDIGDLNGDGHLDIAFGQPGTVALNDGTGAFTASIFAVDSNAQQINIVDLDGDDVNDIAFGFRTHVNDGSGQFTQVATIPAVGASDCTFADFDGDGDQDVACARSLQDELSVALNQGDATFVTLDFLPTEPRPAQVRAANLNGDNHPDLVVAHSSCGSGCMNANVVSAFLGRGDGTFEDPIPITATAGRTVAVGDLDADGLDDLVIGTGNFFAEGNIAILINTTVPAGTPADINGDGSVNVLDLIDLLLCFGSSSVGPCEAADVNADGSVDVLDLIELLINFGS